MNGEEIQNINVRTFMRDRYMELAAMFKEENEGSVKTKEKLLARFQLQEGATKKKTVELYNALVDAGLIKFYYGHGHWKYNPKAEWDNFNIEI